MSFRVVIIGGGASGIAAAIFAARRGAAVTVLEKNEKPLKKLLVTGNGRCNLTNLTIREDSWRSTDPELALRVIRSFGIPETLAFFESIGVFTRDRGGWVYPVNDHAASAAAHLLREAEALKVKIKTKAEVTAVGKKENEWICRTTDYEYHADAVIIASGSCAHYGDGFTSIAEAAADGYAIARRPFEPALVPLVLDARVVGRWGNDRLSGTVCLYENGEPAAAKSGELQLTSYGISGIPVLQISSYIRNGSGAAYEVGLDLLPEYDAQTLSEKIRSILRAEPHRNPACMLSGLFPEKLFKATFSKGETPEEYIHRMKDLRLRVRKKRGMENAMTASGGIYLSGLNEHLEARNAKGLYFIGEAVDVDGDCGGYNLQWAWSSAHAAADGLEV